MSNPTALSILTRPGQDIRCAFDSLMARLEQQAVIPFMYMTRLRRMGAAEGHASMPVAPPDYLGMVMCMVMAIVYDEAVFAWFANDSEGMHLTPVIVHTHARIEQFLSTRPSVDPNTRLSTDPATLTDIVVDALVAMEAGCTQFYPVN